LKECTDGYNLCESLIERRCHRLAAKILQQYFTRTSFLISTA